MPTWWGRKSSKPKDKPHEQEPRGNGGGSVLHFNFIKSSPIRNSPKVKSDKPKSFDDASAFRNSPRVSRDFTPPPAAVADSDVGEKRGVPLPRPSVSSTQSLSNDQGLVFGSTSLSGSSVSSTGSYDDNSTSHSQINSARGQFYTKFNVRSKSPGPGSRGPTSPTSPLHPRLHVLSLDSPTGRQEDGKSQCHPLPLPPGSPTSPSSLSNTRSSGVLENSTANLGKWKKGKLLGRGTFGHVYLGFNRY